MIHLLRATLDFLQAYSGAVTAIAAFFIAVFTLVLALVTGRQARLTRDVIALARMEFIAAWPPRIRVRNVVVAHPWDPDSGVAPPLFAPGLPLECQFFVANSGGTSAWITEALAIVYQNPAGVPMQRPYEGKRANLKLPVQSLAPGQAVELAFTSDQIIDEEGAKTIGTKVLHHQRLFVMGWIEYRDDVGVVRRTGFCREFKASPWDDGRFRRVKSRDYEHEE
jgi:hypothetical protein